MGDPATGPANALLLPLQKFSHETWVIDCSDERGPAGDSCGTGLGTVQGSGSQSRTALMSRFVAKSSKVASGQISLRERMDVEAGPHGTEIP
jgi:hypothetical protein